MTRERMREGRSKERLIATPFLFIPFRWGWWMATDPDTYRGAALVLVGAFALIGLVAVPLALYWLHPATLLPFATAWLYGRLRGLYASPPR